MQLDIYLRETANLATEYKSILDNAATAISSGQSFSKLEQNGLLHVLQVITENAIGKAKHLLKADGQPTPVSAHDAMQKLATLQSWPATTLTQW